MKNFLDKDFLLDTETAIRLYENAAEGLPIFDFHCHLDPQEVWENKSYENITQLWLGGDHYKWRTLRMNGIGERYITGDASDWEKFSAWAETVPNLIGNPLYHWTHMELKMFFGIEKRLSPATAREIYDECNEKLKTSEFTARSFINRANVKFIGTTDDPISTLEYHKLLKNDESFTPIIAPTFRPDGALFIERPTFASWVGKLEQVSGIKTNSLEGFLAALQQRVDYFHENGGRASDHDIQKLEVYVETTQEEAERIFNKGLSGDQLSDEEINAYRCFLLTKLGKMYAGKQWVMQLHMGAIRNNNTKMKELIGPDTGFDSVGESNFAEGISRLLDALEQQNALPRTVLFNLNSKDNPVLAGMMGNFYEEGVPGKIQFGSGWWFNDHIDGMERQMKDLANVGLLSHFIGMLTDSRSFLSYARHEYFRRILCNILGEWVERGLAPDDMEFVEQMVRNIGYNNAEKFFLER
ncbi:glucuronate isomerase [Neobacillus niacini]|uniref:glucuronate isomerase n=1 Tax=Neobacillus niacini TaxID=86668 RepID=UPI002864A554|nr:glucuronate isomerase [Neobacillus niacini]MDR7076936.1 glucuronate isomerase [Neobacillus niacini]